MTLAVVFAAPLLARAQEAAPQFRVAMDPRVHDAVSLWLEWVEYQAATNRVPGVSVGIVYDQELVATAAFGLANPREKIAAEPDTLYSICSISKLFTAVAVMQQRDAGKLRLDDSVSQHLDWFNLPDVHPDDEPITIRALLTHSSGVPRESDFPYWTQADFPFPTSAQIRERLGEQETLYPAVRYFQYSNLGMALLGEVASAVSGKPYADLIRAKILDPLGMKDTYTEVPVQLRGQKLAIGHTALKRDGTRDPVGPFQTRGIAPAAGFASNVLDLAKFAMWQFRLLESGGQELLRASSLREMHRVQWVDPDWKTTWGLGFSVIHEGDRTLVGHSGGCPGYFTQIRLDPAARIAVIVLSNAIGAEVGLYSTKAFDLIGPAIAAAKEKTAPATRDPVLDQYVGVYESIWDQHAIVRWDDGLAQLNLASRDPKQHLVKLKHAGGHTFRRVREDDKSLGEAVSFEVSDDGTVHRYQQHSIWREKVK